MRRIAVAPAAVTWRSCRLRFELRHERRAVYDRDGCTGTVATPAVSRRARRGVAGSVSVGTAGLERTHRESRIPTALWRAAIDHDDLEEHARDQEACDRSGETARAMIAIPIHGIEPTPAAVR